MSEFYEGVHFFGAVIHSGDLGRYVLFCHDDVVYDEDRHVTHALLQTVTRLQAMSCVDMHDRDIMWLYNMDAILYAVSNFIEELPQTCLNYDRVVLAVIHVSLCNDCYGYLSTVLMETICRETGVPPMYLYRERRNAICEF